MTFGLVTRRTALKGGMALVAGFATGCTVTPGRPPLVGFRPVPLDAVDLSSVTISPDYEYQVLVPWGDPIVPSGPRFRYPPSAADQQQQVGIGHDGMAYFPLPDAPQRGLLVLNHEYGRNPHVIGKGEPDNRDEVRASQHAHGLSIVGLEQRDGAWRVSDSPYARRIHAGTPVVFTGPAAGSALLRNPAGNPPLGTLGNCANGVTPWGTYLTCEENFNFYFSSDTAFEPDERQKRYGLSRLGGGYFWHRYDPRFDVARADYANEGNRFGWVVEIDPMAPDGMAAKRTALGRFKHEGAAVTIGAGNRAVAYMGDDEVFEFIYKFVSNRDYESMRAAGVSPLDEGTLFAARFDADGTGEWLPLTVDNPKIAGAFADQAELLVYARIAASLAGATPMDRPEWTTIAPSGEVFCSLTNNVARREPDAANPNAPNRNGHIIRWREDDPTATRFTWDHFLLCADVYESEQSLGSPDALWADPDGRLFIGTDGTQRDGLENQLIVADTVTGSLSRLLVGVPGCEITGLTTTPDRRTLFVNIQHPGNGDASQTSFPAPNDGETVPRDCTLAVRRRDGGVVGS